MDKIPDFIYKYYPPSESALRALHEQCIYFGVPANFNDPYDCAYVPHVKSLTEKERQRLRDWLFQQPGVIQPPIPEGDVTRDEQESVKMANQALTMLRDANLTENKIACFSERNDNVLMWSTYGGRNQGFCLQFCTGAVPMDSKHMVKVRYSETPPHFDFIEMLEKSDAGKIMDLVRTKSCDWAYEREWRLMAEQGRDKVTYAPRILKAVFLGVYTHPEVANFIRSVIRTKNPDTELWQGYFDKDEYKVSFERCD